MPTCFSNLSPPFRSFLMVLAAAFLAGCTSEGSNNEPVLATAYSGPMRLAIRAEVSPASKEIASTRHGEKLEIVQVRRRFVRVRTPSGQIGWTDSRDLLSDVQMESLATLAKRAAKLPSQGEGKVYAPLNVHTDPTRQSTSFHQISDDSRFEVVAHKWTPRIRGQQAPAFRIEKKAPPPRKKKKQPEYPPLALPPAPPLPRDWREMSQTTLPKPVEQEPVASVPLEDWYLVRTKDGKAGWVLARSVALAIPDEVAQYSEGARITSYHALAEVPDGDQIKHHWVWTTIRDGQPGVDFDSFRIFIWNLRRHRYETAYIERRVEGYYPTTATPGKLPKFSLVLRGEDGNLYQHNFFLEGYIVRSESVLPWKGSLSQIDSIPIAEDDAEAAGAEESSQSWKQRIQNLFKR